AGRGLRCGRRAAMAAAAGAAGDDPSQHRRHVAGATEERGMTSLGTLISVAAAFGWLSLFAVGGAAAAIPAIHRIAVDLNHWMTDAQFADAFAIAQLSPGPNVLIVSLVGYHAAGIAGALVATLAMCVPTAALAYTVSRLLHRAGDSPWPALVQAALV